MPAPPPESEPAMVSARGTSSRGKVVPSLRLEWTLHAVRTHDGETRLGDLADVGERHAEALVEPLAGRIDAARVDRGEQLVVLAPRQRQLEGIDRQRGGEVGQLES